MTSSYVDDFKAGKTVPDAGWPVHWAKELYHLDTDQFEMVNLASDPAYADEVVELGQLSGALARCAGAFIETT